MTRTLPKRNTSPVIQHQSSPWLKDSLSFNHLVQLIYYIVWRCDLESVISVTQGFFMFYSSIIIQRLSKRIVYCWFAHWLLQPATCNWHSAILNLQPVIFFLLHATFNWQFTVCNLRPVIFNVQPATCNLHAAIYCLCGIFKPSLWLRDFLCWKLKIFIR